MLFFIQRSHQGPRTGLEVKARNVSVHYSTNHTSSRVLSLSCHRCKQSIPVKTNHAERQTISDLNGSTLWQQMRKNPEHRDCLNMFMSWQSTTAIKSDLIIECTDWRGSGGELMQSMHSNMHIAHDQQVVKRNLKCLHGAATSANSSAKQRDKALRNSPSDYRLARLHHPQGETDINKHVISQSEHLIMLIRFPL